MSNKLKCFIISGFFLAALSTGCVNPAAYENSETLIFSTVTTAELTPMIVNTSLPTATIPQVTTEPVITPDNSLLRICSPFKGFSYEKLTEAVSNQYTAPPPGSDDPHEGVDLAVMDNQRIGYAGEEVHAVTNGRVAGVIKDRFPYGNAVFIETPYDFIDESIAADLGIPVLTFAPPNYAPLFCPGDSLNFFQDPDGEQSLYLVYAHLLDSPEINVGDVVECGDIIGRVGSTGNALNPHLHLEVRTGPTGQVFDSMAHYENSASLEEMGAYCSWRISGTFQLMDPMKLLKWIGEAE